MDSNNLTTLHTYSCGCIKFSIGVKNIINILSQENIKYCLEYPIFEIGELVLAHPYRYDFALLNIDNIPIRFIEFDGEQHYIEASGHMAKETLKERQSRDRLKNEYALSHDIPLVRIPYWERNNITLEMLIGD